MFVTATRCIPNYMCQLYAMLPTSRYLFYFDSNYLDKIANADTNKIDSVAVCVKMCANETLSNVADFQNFYDRYGASLCNYDVPRNSFATDGTTCPDTSGITGSVGPQ